MKASNWQITKWWCDYRGSIKNSLIIDMAEYMQKKHSHYFKEEWLLQVQMELWAQNLQ